MRKFKDLTEAKETAAFTIGRFNPPTIGHEKVITSLVKKSGGNSTYIFPTHSQDSARNPLPHALKIAYMRKMFPKYKNNILVDKARNVFEIANTLYNKGHTSVICVVGSDRVKEFETLLNKYNGVEGKKHGFYKFDSIKVISAGQRDPDADDVSGMSASKMRDAAKDGNKDLFLQGLPKGFRDGDKLYRDVRKYMGIREEREMGDMSDFEYIRDQYLTGKIWNIGDIVEANNVSGEIVRRGTNYLSFVEDNGKVHKAWLYEIEIKERKSALQKLKDFDKSRAASGKPPIFTDKKPPKFVRMKKKGGMSTMNVPTDDIDKWEKKGYSITEKFEFNEAFPISVTVKDKKGKTHTTSTRDLRGATHALLIHYKEIPPAKIMPATKETKPSKTTVNLGTEKELAKQAKHMLRTHPSAKYATGAEVVKLDQKMVKGATLDERNYRKEYDNYQGRPEQIARRSSRNKARRIMGDKTKIGMDVGHKDNNPLNNDPDNLKNEDPSDNRREPRLRENPLDEMSWYNRAKAKLDQMTHPRGYDKMIKSYVNAIGKDKKKMPSKTAADVARDYNVSGRNLIQYINKLVKQGVLPQELKAEMQQEKLGPNADQGDYIDDFQKSDAPQFKGKSQEKRKKMAIAAFLSKNEEVKLDELRIDPKKSSEKDIKHQIKYHEKMRDFYSGNARSKKSQNDEIKRLKGILKDRGFKEEVKLPKDDLNWVKTGGSFGKKRKFPTFVVKKEGNKYKAYDEQNKMSFKAASNSLEGLGKLLKPYIEKRTGSWKFEEVKQDKDIKDKEGTQPSKYYAGGMAKSTKDKRATHFKKKKEGPAPGDASAETKPSVHTKKFKQMYGEARAKQAVAGSKVQKLVTAHGLKFKGKVYKEIDMELVKINNNTQMVTFNIIHPREIFGNETNISFKALRRGPFMATDTSKINEVLNEKITALVNKSEKSGISYGILKKVYDRGMAAYKTGHRPGTTSQQWALARVNSFITKGKGTWGKADADLAKQVEAVEEACCDDCLDEQENPCWDGYKQVGTKMKNGKRVPNCVPEETEVNGWGEISEKSEYDGKSVELNNPTKGDRKKYKVYVRNDKGNVVKVEFGDPNMEIKRDDPARRAAFRARHNCDQKKDKTTAGYWSCKFWSSKSVTDLMKG